MSETTPMFASTRTAATFTEEISRRAAEFEQARRMPDDLMARMAAAGLFRQLVPKAYGGLEAHPLEVFESLEYTARADAAAGWCMMIAITTGMLSATLPERWARRIYAEHPDVITVGVTAPMGRAKVEDDSLLISGRWPFGSGSHNAHWISGGCMLEADGAPVLNRHGQPEVHLAFFEAGDVHIHDNWHTSGLCGTGSNDIEVNALRIPRDRTVVLGSRPNFDTPLYRFPTLGLLALGVSAVSLGIAQHAIDLFTGLADAKVPTGSSRQLAARSSVQKDLASAVASVRAARALTRETISRAWDQAERGERLTTTIKADLRLAATNNTWSAVKAVDLLYHAAGGSSIYLTNDLQRCFRDVHVSTQHIMVAQPTLEVVGKVMLGIDPKTLL